MPLRSVEAATRDDAIAAAREQFGPTARVVGVRRVRSGGVLGFFATERYVAEVASEPAGRPAVPVPAASRSSDDARDEAPSDFSSPLASAAPARARVAAPARNGAAAWAAEAARTSVSSPASSPAMARVAPPAAADVRPVAAPRTASPARTGSQPAVGGADQDRVSELAGLLAPHATTPEPAAPGRSEYPRAEFRRSAPPREERPALLDDELSGDDGDFAVPAAPSPFTAALARMVAGDRDVRQAVREALDDPAAPRPRGDGDSWRSRPGAFGPADTPVAPPAARQKEETVGDQVIAPSTSADQPVGVTAWAAEPEALVPSVSTREEAIAEVLRAALAQGHSDDALAGILRKVLAGVAPQTALAEPELAVPVRPVPEVVLAAEVAPSVVAPVAPVAPIAPVAPVVPVAPVSLEVAEVAEPEAPVAVELPPVLEPAVPAVVAAAPAAAPSLFPDAAPVPAPPAPAFVPPAPVYAAPAPLFAAPAPLPLPPLFAPPVGSMWGDPSPAPLWGDPVTVAVSRVRQSDAPIWAEVTQQQATPDLAVEAGPAPVAEPADVTETVAASVEPVGTEVADTDGAADLAGHDPARVEDAADEIVADGFTMIELVADEVVADEVVADEVVADETPAADDLPTVDDVPAAEVADGTLAETALEGPVDTGIHTDDAETTVVDIAATVVDADVPAADTDVPAIDADVPAVEADVPAVDTDIHTEDAATTAVDTETAADTESHTVGTEATAVDTQADERVEIPVAEQVDEVPVPLAAGDVSAETAADEAVEVQAEVQAEVEAEVAAEVTELAPTMARTASDPAPMMSFDATTVMPPLSLLPPLPSSRGRGRPPVPPASRPLTPRAAATTATPPAPPALDEPASPAAGIETPDVAAVFTTPATRSWATVTRLPVAPLMATPETTEMPELDTDAPVDALPAPSEPQPAPESPAREQDALLPPEPALDPMSPARNALGDLRGRLEALGVPGSLLGTTFADDVAGHGTYAALTRALAMRLPAAPELPCGAGEVVFVVGPGFETLRAARSLAASLRLDPDSVQWATRGELAGLAPKSSRVTTVETALDRRQDAAESGTVTIVAVDAPMRTDAYWMSQMLAIWSPAAVWVVVEATRKPEDLEPWIDGLPRVDALIVADTDLSADPAAVLRRVPAPVAMLDGVRATPHRWASLLCERLESTKA